MRRKKDLILNVKNIYNKDNKSPEELKLIFNKKMLNMIYNLEKNSFYSCENSKKSV